MPIYVLDTCNVHIYVFMFPSHVLVCVGESFLKLRLEMTKMQTNRKSFAL